MDQVINNPPGLFVAHNIPSALFAALNLRASGVKSAMVVHSDDPYYYKLVDAFVLSGAQSAVDLVIPVSAYLEDKLGPVIGDRAAVKRIPYGAPSAEKPAKWDGEELHLLYVGRFSLFQKRIDFVAEALCAACDQIPGVRASMAGDGPERGLVENILKVTDGSAKVADLGGLSSTQVLEVMQSAHVMVLLSDFEGIPISLMEGMSAGLVPIVTPIRSGIPELIADGVNGKIVPRDLSAFVNAVKQLRDDPEAWRSMSKAARQRYEEGFSPQIVMDAWAGIIGYSPENCELPAKLDLPVHSWLDFWVDASMCTGWGKVRLYFQRAIWRIWGLLSPSNRDLMRRYAQRIFRHDGFRLNSTQKG